MIDDGLFKLFPMDAVFGMHNWPGMEVGTFGVVAGPIMASSNTFEIVLEGKGAHGAMPHLGVDPVMAAVQLAQRSEEHTSELQSLMRISYAVFCLKKKKPETITNNKQRHRIILHTTDL